MEIEFKKAELSDKDWIYELARAGNNVSMDFSFGMLHGWQDIFFTEIARKDDFLITKSNFEGNNKNCISYTYPIGKGTQENEIKIVEEIIEHTKYKLNKCPLLYAITDDTKNHIEELFPGKFEFVEDRTTFEYIYETEKLATLRGKNLRNKRNQVNGFNRDYPNWSFEKITKDNLDECIDMYATWYGDHEERNSSGLEDEQTVIGKMFSTYFEVGYLGGILRVDGKIVAFTFGEKLSDEMFITHIEKAHTYYNGAYQVINQQFAQNCLSDYKYVNREDDTGDENLRTTKLSYRPITLLKKYHVFLKEDFKIAY